MIIRSRLSGKRRQGIYSNSSSPLAYSLLLIKKITKTEKHEKLVFHPFFWYT